MNARRIAFITGGTRGIGLEVARLLAHRSFQAALGGRDAARGKTAAGEVGATFVPLDVTDAASIAAAVQIISASFGRLDVLVNNAAILLDGETPVEEVTAEALRATFETNTIAPIQVVQAFLPLLRASDDPRIINVSSGAGQLSGGERFAWAPAYSASKAALNALTQQLAATFRGIAVNAVCPGWCRTTMGGAGAPRTAEQGADTIAWLAAEAPPTLTGRFFRDRAEIPW